MPSFHTKTIENILGPVADQVSRLVIIHEEAEEGKGMPDLTRPISAVSRAVENLVRVGKDTYCSSDDKILKQDMPIALHRIEEACKSLEQSAQLLVQEPFSITARKKLIDGARGILQGTSMLLIAFDESEVRKIIYHCRKVLDYFSVAEVIENMEDLVKYVKDMTPSLTSVTKMVMSREKDLTNTVHSEILQRCLTNIKEQTPLLISSMKIYIQILHQEGKGIEEAKANRNYLINCMSYTIEEIIRILQTTSLDEDESLLDTVTYLKKALKFFEGKLVSCTDWLQESTAVVGSYGEKCLRQALETAIKIASKCNKSDKDVIVKATGDITSLTDALCELRSDNKGDSPQAFSLARSIQQSLANLNKQLACGLNQVTTRITDEDASNTPTFHEHQDLYQCIHEANVWLTKPSISKGERKKALRSVMYIVTLARQFGIIDQVELQNFTEDIRQLDTVRAQPNFTPSNGAYQDMCRAAGRQLKVYTASINKCLTSQVLLNFLDIISPLKQFIEAVNCDLDHPNRLILFEESDKNINNFGQNICQTLRSFAQNGNVAGKKDADDLFRASKEIQETLHQFVSAGKIKFHYPENKYATEHFDVLYDKLSDGVLHARNMLDSLIDPNTFIRISLENITHHSHECEEAFVHNDSPGFVEHTSHIARLANRVLMVAKQESENSEDVDFHQNLEQASLHLNKNILTMVQTATKIASAFNNPDWLNEWRDSNNQIIWCIKNVHCAIAGDSGLTESLSKLNLTPNQYRNSPTSYGSTGDKYNVDSPISNIIPPRPPPPPETDDEDDDLIKFPPPEENQPILQAAHSLHDDVQQWSSKDNEIIAAAKKMALFMAKLSQLVRGEGGNKKDLIDCAKDIAESSGDVTRLAKELARQCTDKRMRTNLLQVCERIPTIATQLKILSTVKATMFGAQGCEEDIEATEMLVGNAQNLMHSVKETVKAAEAASIKIRTDFGYRFRWVRKKPWYQY